MDWLVKGFPHLVLHVFGGLLLALVPVLFCLLLKRAGVLDRFSEATHWSSTRPRLEQMLVLVLLAGVIVYGSTKTGDNSASPRLRVRPMAEAPSTSAITAADVARGWRESGSDAGGPVEMPAGAVTNELLRRRGGFDWAFRVEPDNWRSAWKGGVLTGVTVLARGEVRPDVGTLYYPVPVTNGVSLLPEARWGLLPNGGASVLSHAVTTNGSLLLDWRNAAVGRDANSPTNLQMEIFSDGSFVWRTDGGSTSYLPVLPFDYDGDGLENAVDPEPLAPNPVDAHGTPAEWYRVVCSNVFETAGGDLGWKEEVNTNAYYFVDVVAEEGPAPVWFNADRDSRLGSPVVVALAGETNRVPLLIGVEYAVTSTVPFSVTLPEGGFAETNRQGGCSVTVKWPLDFAFVEDADAPGAYTVEVVPYDPGVAFTWNSPVPGGGASLLSVAHPSASSCSCWGGSGPSVVFDCSDNCDCGGGCQASGMGGLEDAEFAVTGGVCRCSRPDEPHDDPPPPPPDPLVGGLSITFSKGAVIFEDAYRNTEDGPLAPRQSTTTRVTVSASGGPFGGSFSLTTRNLEKLIAANGPGPVALTPGMTLGPYETYSATFECAGVEASGSENDVEVEGTFTEAVTGRTENPCAQATVVRVEIVPEVQYPRSLPNRHIFGVCEEVGCYYLPGNLTGAAWQSSGGTLESNSNGNKSIFLYYLTPGEVEFTFSYNSCSYSVHTQCVTPTAISSCGNPAIRTYAIPENHAGGIGMHLDLTLCPSNVSFKGFRVMEQALNGVPTGYFTNTYFTSWWNHTEVQGANKVITIGDQNDFGDDAAMVDSVPILPNQLGWSTGDITWPILPVWRGPSDYFMQSNYRNLAAEQQKFTLDSMGTVGVEKFKRRVERPLNGSPTLMTIP